MTLHFMAYVSLQCKCTKNGALYIVRWNVVNSDSEFE